MKDSPTDLLGALCAIDSRTVEGAAGTVQVAELLGERLKALGFALEWIDASTAVPPRGRHLKAVRNPNAPVRLLLMGHTDTVLSPAEVPFRADAQTGRVYGSGVCDMKGGCVVLLEALSLALEADARMREAGQVVLLNCAEEFCEPSFRLLARDAARGARACLNFEPATLAGSNGEPRLVISRKGVVRFHLTCTGRPAHAGNAHPAGVNAIRELARKIEQIEALTDYDNDVTANVGRISGGRVSNQVAAEAEASFEVRAFQQDRLERAIEAVKAICATSSVVSAADGATTCLKLEEHRSYPPWPRNEKTDALASRYKALAARRGVSVVTVCSGGGADSSHVAGLTPTLDGLGIRGGGMHTPDEWADVATLPVHAAIAADLMVELVRDQNVSPGELCKRPHCLPA
jgi:glutamate carboxypeptidase